MRQMTSREKDFSSEYVKHSEFDWVEGIQLVKGSPNYAIHRIPRRAEVFVSTGDCKFKFKIERYEQVSDGSWYSNGAIYAENLVSAKNELLLNAIE